MAREHDLAPVFTRLAGDLRASAGAALIRGTVVTWDSDAGHVISIRGLRIEEPPVLGTLTLAPGDVVAVLQQSTSVLVLGSITAP